MLLRVGGTDLRLRALRGVSLMRIQPDKSSVQHLICEAAYTEDGVQYPLKTTDQPLPDATLVRRTGWIEPPLNALMFNFGGDVNLIPFFDTFTELFLRSDKVRTIIRPDHSGRTTPTGNKPLLSHYTGTCVHGRNDFNIDITSSQTSEVKSPPLLGGPTNGDIEWAEVINLSLV